MAPGCVITVGNFDGVHVGHRAILARAAEFARARQVPVKAVTFEPHPAAVLRPGHEPPRLSAADEKSQLLRGAGADEVVVLRPDAALLALSPLEFIGRLAAEHRPLAFVEGVDFRFGKARAGDVAMLDAFGRAQGFDTVIVPDAEVALSDHTLVAVSSSLIRWLLRHGRVADAARCLARAFALRGPVVKGDQRGRTIGVPTANLDPASFSRSAIPGDGVYAGDAQLPGGRTVPAAISVGLKPTFRHAARTVEAHLLGFTGDLYGQPITLRFHRWLRDQQPFPSLDALKAQLARDIAMCKFTFNPTG
jgi:riboflavin kinase/FMN adenylyltransferase